MIKKIVILALVATLVASMTVASVMACARTPGYWKNHEWPVDAVIVGNPSGTHWDVTEAETLDKEGIMWTPVRGDVRINLAQKVVAMKLSIIVWPGSAADALLAQADTWFATYGLGPVSPSSPAGQAGLAIAGQLDYLLNLWDVD